MKKFNYRWAFLGASAFAILAFANLPSRAVVPQTQVGDAAYSVLGTDCTVTTTTAFTAARTWTLPYAGATQVGQSAQCPAQLQIIDTAGVVTSTNTLTIAPASGDTINGNAANLILSAAGTRTVLIPTTGSNWQSYTIGDFRSTTVLTGAAVSLSTATAADIMTISLSQGEWECRATISRNLNASTSVTVLSGSIGATADTIGTQGVNSMTSLQTAANVMGTTGQDTKIGPTRILLTATTTYHLVAKDTFSVSTNAAYGDITCRRIR